MDDDPTNLTVEKLMATKARFDQTLREIKAADALDGVCICANCFGDRAMMAWPGRVYRRYCLAEPGRITDLGGTIRRDLIR